MNIHWIASQYGDSESVTVGILRIMVYYDAAMSRDHIGPRYRWEVNGLKSAKRFNDKIEAKESALRFAKKKLQETLDAMGD